MNIDLEALEAILFTPYNENVLDKPVEVDPVVILDYLQLEADRSSDRKHRKRAIRCLCEVARQYQRLPPSLYLHHIEKEEAQWPLRGGGFADIWKGRLAGSGRYLCLKVLRMFEDNDEVKRRKIIAVRFWLAEFCREALLWRQLDHPNVLSFLGVNVELFAPGFCLVLPWMENGDILSYLKRNPTHDRLKSLREIAAGMEYLHSHEPAIIHADIRGANILVKDDLTCALADFGLAIAMETKIMPTSSGSSMKGSIRWLSPEVILGDRNAREKPSRDIYAFGCTVLELITLQPPFAIQMTDAGVILAVISGCRPPRPEGSQCSDELWDLVQRCWAHDPRMRPSAGKILRTLKHMSTCIFSSSSKQNLMTTAALPSHTEPEEPTYDGLEFVTPSEQPDLSSWLGHARDLFTGHAQSSNTANALITSRSPHSMTAPVSFASSPNRDPSSVPRSTTTRANPYDSRRRNKLRLDELWSIPTRRKGSQKQASEAGTKRDMEEASSSEMINLPPRMRFRSRAANHF
ncbi:hypothetical protein PQX77_012839 [Marasmius sp. AFHP31]|nr:hypothetical protein PQX77_012839 [Marasmius sp. AFHP31]